MSSIVTSTVQLDPNFTDPPKIQYFPPENSGGDFFSIWWGHGMTLILSPQQIHSLREAILSSPEVGMQAELIQTPVQLEAFLSSRAEAHKAILPWKRKSMS